MIGSGKSSWRPSLSMPTIANERRARSLSCFSSLCARRTDALLLVCRAGRVMFCLLPVGRHTEQPFLREEAHGQREIAPDARDFRYVRDNIVKGRVLVGQEALAGLGVEPEIGRAS